MTVYTPSQNTGQNIFVFGSNRAGIHGCGAAKEAYRHWGAKLGYGEGLFGNSYALPTKDEQIVTLPLEEIAKHVQKFLIFAHANPALTFLVTAVGCGLAGYKPEQIAPLFVGAPENCVLPDAFKLIINYGK